MSFPPPDKPTLRRAMELRRAAARSSNPEASFALRDVFLRAVNLPAGGIVSSYNARGSEMDPTPLAEALRACGHAIALPAMAGKNEPLLFRIHRPGDVLVTNAIGIGEPGAKAAIAVPDILLVPLLAFDRKRQRLGAGGGYYDRTLADLRRRKSVLAIGIGFACQEVSELPTEAHDAVLDKIATEIQVF